ncbi:hypothetical protein K439DRAFT_1622253 [Ramaria rubella]|nr:hypothetical protein K439DRAFT_1622253 [Ramaria rubella]
MYVGSENIKVCVVGHVACHAGDHSGVTDDQVAPEVQCCDQERVLALQNQLKKPIGLPSPLANQLLLPPTSGTLARLKGGAVTKADKKIVNIAPFIRGKVEPELGFYKVQHTREESIADIVGKAIEMWNKTWLKTRELELKLYVSLTGILVNMGSQFWDVYLGENSTLLQNVLSGVKKIKNVGEVLSLEWHLHYDRHMWAPGGSGLVVKPCTDVTLQVGAVFRNEAGKWGINWEDAEQEDGKIENQHTWAGTMKYAYQGTLQGKNVVFKWFYNLRDGPEKVSIAGNVHALTAEAQQLHMGQEILNVFYEQVKNSNVQVFDDLAFSQAFLVWTP